MSAELLSVARWCLTVFAVSVSSLVKNYGSKPALAGVDLEIAPGAIFGLVGPNGAGKTTLLSILAGLKTPSAGSFSLGPAGAGIGFMPDTPSYYPWLTGPEVLDYAARLRGRQIDDNEISWRMAQVGLTHVGPGDSTKIGGYSRGMRQRLAVAATLLGDPSVLLLDEPCSALDPAGRAEVLEIIASFSGKATVIFSTHLLSDVERVCDSVAMLDRGRVIMAGPIESIRQFGAAPGFRLALECDDQSLIGEISRYPWFAGIAAGRPGYYTVTVSDFDTARRDLLQLFAARSTPLIEFSRADPSLEEVFLKVLAPR